MTKFIVRSVYWDKRTEFFKSYYEKSVSYKDYVKTGTPEQNEKWQNFEQKIVLSNLQVNRVKSFKRKINNLVMSGVWCGDCIRQGPMFRAIELANPIINFRFIDNRENPELLEELKINGAQKVPVIVSLSEDFYELSRFGDRHLSVYRRKAAQEFGAACDAGIIAPENNELELEVNEWIDYFERIQIMLRLAPALRERYGD